jgi:hypothetical protein
LRAMWKWWASPSVPLTSHNHMGPPDYRDAGKYSPAMWSGGKGARVRRAGSLCSHSGSVSFTY